ncbi:C39 family peptidase [Sporosarcina trichiuri]|uniref:C39 family peptidase n=1 Tax=Sporosarcina trichiuri TaxID=3056445 RepID=UPI0025B45374|nr:C39 family peptidase [Sporosarcina sp. 0.2-SM1T-5]WJY27752.1 hypothetical protein QWT68_01765 [Sporosarcina sp. 0.2-SM1T-5]
MPLLKEFTGKSQYDSDIGQKIRSSACGPVTVSLLLRYARHPLGDVPVDKLYRLLGTTRIGLFTGRFVRRLRKLLGAGWTVEKCTVEEALSEIDEGRPVAAKFDKWLSRKWRQSAAFDYHWVPVIGYERDAGDIQLAVHDNGSPSSPSRLRYISYKENAPVLTFVRIVPRRL